ncbi:hypothetical protein COK56_25380 [Bacillus cereus]|nr:hypothetical protein COK56_25380 [Bacillus cereus]
MEIFRNLAVKVEGLNNKGSGCIYEHSNEEGTKYVFTAKHCLFGEEVKSNITREEIEEIKVFDIHNNSLEIKDIIFPEEENLDFAIIEVYSECNYPNVTIKSPKGRMKYVFFGFPEYLEGNDDDGEPLYGDIAEFRNEKITLQNKNGPLCDFEDTALVNTRGFSGSGIYNIEETGDLQLIGIVEELRDQKGTHGRLQGVNIDIINEFLVERKGEALFPYALHSFDNYLEMLIEEENEELDKNLKTVFQKVYNSNINEVNPKFIFDKLRFQLFLPYDDKKIINRELWIGWLKLLIFIALYKNAVISRDTLSEHINLGQTSSVEGSKKFFYTEARRMPVFVKSIYRNIYDDIKDNDFIIVNSEKFYGSKIPSHNQIHKVIQDIDVVNDMYKKGIDITSYNRYKKIKIMHIDYIIEKIEEKLMDWEELKIWEFEKEVQSFIKALFDEIEGIVEKECEKIET